MCQARLQGSSQARSKPAERRADIRDAPPWDQPGHAATKRRLRLSCDPRRLEARMTVATLRPGAERMPIANQVLRARPGLPGRRQWVECARRMAREQADEGIPGLCRCQPGDDARSTPVGKVAEKIVLAGSLNFGTEGVSVSSISEDDDKSSTAILRGSDSDDESDCNDWIAQMRQPKPSTAPLVAPHPQAARCTSRRFACSACGTRRLGPVNTNCQASDFHRH